MKKNLVLVALLLICPIAFAQEPALTVSKIDSLPELVQYYLNESTSKHFEDPKAPRFLLRDKTGDLVFGVGGTVKARMYYDNQGNKGNTFDMAKEDEASKYDNEVVDLNMNMTSLVFSVLGNTKIGIVDAMVSMDFGNTGGGVRLTQAYVDLFGLRVGKANTGFRDDESISVIDASSLVSQTGLKVPQLAYSYRFKNGIRAHVGFEFPQSTSVWVINEDNTSVITPLNNKFPNLTANIYYSGDRIHLYGGVNSRLMHYYNDQVFQINLPAYAFQLGMNWSFVKTAEQTHKLYAQGIWTHGMADCCSGMRKKGLAVVYDVNTGKYQIPNSWGGLLGYQAKFGANTIDLAASICSVSGQIRDNVGNIFDKSYTCVLNYFRKFLTNGTAGAEVNWGRRHDIATNTYSNCRVYLYLQYDF